MPGPVSDSYDSDFGTGYNRQIVVEAMQEVVELVSKQLGSELKYIVGVAEGEDGANTAMILTERQLRLIRFGLKHAVECIGSGMPPLV